MSSGMTVRTRPIYRLVRQIRQQAGDDLVSLIRFLAERRGTRRALNGYYSILPTASQVRFYGRFAKIFRERHVTFQDGSWCVRVGGKQLVVPLRSEYGWLDWDAALSIIGHDPEVKCTYRALAGLEHPPRVAFDIGANYGTHSLFLLTLGIQTISFEPNPACHSYFRLVCERNRLGYRLEPAAMGATAGMIELWYPDREEWLGTTQLSVREHLTGNIREIKASMTTVDDYSVAHGMQPDLIKIDVEGMDFDVLRGAARALRWNRPVVLFESRKSMGRIEFADFLADSGYRICLLPLVEAMRPRSLSRQEFLQSDQTNFGAVPTEKFGMWPPKFRMTQ